MLLYVEMRKNGWQLGTRNKNIDSYKEVLFLGKNVVLSKFKNENENLKTFLFLLHMYGLLTIFNRCSKF